MAHAKLKIVLVEDDEGMRPALTRMLTGASYQVQSFASAEALLDALGAGAAREDIACIICDVRLPGISGFELHRRIAEQGPLPPWIFITAHDAPLVREKAAHAAAACLLKPFEGRTLMALIAEVMGPPVLPGRARDAEA